MGRQESRVPVSGGDLAVVDYGGSGPDVILIHSVGHCSAVWEDVAAALGEDAHVVALDLRGHGQSSAEADEADEADEATGFAQITSDLQAAGQASGVRPTEAMQQAVGNLAYQGAFTDGATNAFLAGAFMIWAASLIVWIFLSVRHEELAVDDAPAGVHAG